MLFLCTVVSFLDSDLSVADEVGAVTFFYPTVYPPFPLEANIKAVIRPAKANNPSNSQNHHGHPPLTYLRVPGGALVILEVRLD